jgi:hypothetical protein
VAFLGFVLVKVFKAVWEAIIESLVSALQDSGSLGKECMDPERERIDRFCPSVITVLQCALGCLCVWVTFWVEGGVLVMGLIPFAMVALVILWNMASIAGAFACLFISPCLGAFCDDLCENEGEQEEEDREDQENREVLSQTLELEPDEDQSSAKRDAQDQIVEEMFDRGSDIFGIIHYGYKGLIAMLNRFWSDMADGHNVHFHWRNDGKCWCRRIPREICECDPCECDCGCCGCKKCDCCPFYCRWCCFHDWYYCDWDWYEPDEAHRSLKVSPFAGIMCGLDYFHIGSFAIHIWHATRRSHMGKKVVSLLSLYVFTVLNVYWLVNDAKIYHGNRLSFFLGAVCVRGIFLPFMCLLHPLTGFLFHARSSLLQWLLRLATILAGVLTLFCLIAPSLISKNLSILRFQELPRLPETWSMAPDRPRDLSICSNRSGGLSVIDLVGLAFGGYDLGRNDDVFNRQMNFFFGPNATDWIDYEVHELETDVPLIVYNISGTTVFAFRGFASTRELSIQVEMLASLRVTPTFLDLLPFHDELNELYLSSATAYASLLGWHWFSPRSPTNDLLEKASQIYDDMDMGPESPVVFVGVNSGGTIAKHLALLKRRRGVAFLSPPVDMDGFDNRHELEGDAIQWVTNIVNSGGLFSGEDTGFGENFALVGDPDIIGKDEVYPSFCNLAETCGHHAQFGDYCRAAIGDEKLSKIRSFA